jgi:predicted lipoprotein with Yx(FWY)xxD motif
VAGRTRIVVATTAGAVLLAGSGMLGQSASASAAPSKGEGAKISLAHTKDGKVLVGANGHSLYTFQIDTKNHSNCKGTCLKHWFPATSTAKPKAGAGVGAAHLGTTSKGQVTYYGHPLYTFVSDKKAGQVKGEDLFASGGYWSLTNAKGKVV